ncbi:prepilin-type N-terminal cleavage/methylation domain-containing protein [Luteibacter pinisoli]|nr:prepilin-type N-terminal cleavage/methylation domain-containing protein [Luteibacter pinisoli]
MKMRGMTLVELVVGLAVASTVAAVVLVGSAAVATQVRRGFASSGATESADAALAAMLADVRRDGEWSTCLPARGCPVYVGGAYGMALVVGRQRAWTIQDGLRLCAGRHCERVFEGATALQVLVDTDVDGGIRHDEARRGDASRARLVELRLSLRDGTSRSRWAWIPP